MDSGCGTMVQRLLLTPSIAYSKFHPQNITLRFASKKWNKNIYRLKYKIIFTADAVVISFALFNIFIITNERTNGAALRAEYEFHVNQSSSDL